MARQKLGQHFLVQPSILDRIAAAACVSNQSQIIEIGAGRGALTARLLARARRVVAIEIDPTLAAHLHQKFAAEPRLEIVTADALAIDLRQWGPAALAGNLPYYAATAILERAATLGPDFPQAVFLIQKEVARRVTARPGSRDYGFLTVKLALYAQSEILFEVPPGAFRPPPKVDSAVVRLAWHPQAPALAIADPDAFLRFVSAAFRHKRKIIRNNLAPLYPKNILDALPASSRRAEQLGLEELATSYRSVAS